ncbi:site-specific DNA-methyltransferase [Pseudochrobactrum sp. Wa41.01b-1]|uniref:DNA-methyltransferase n=1 Tax=Pseudochrobactrum sp. Wa41.01b-1 TaxID=2864102 RepID=UPI001C690650|nr:site-specific DNA-methyltransferase [Pseudochrobactrum sp. Wa41.01b-1]QYM72873.1 site-specific DNA-methyltransferase [Pseudochrobactrum sp. Wa41.01b-1]
MKLYLGDCLEIMPSLPDTSVDLILADLPYGTTQNKWDSHIPLDDLWREYWRVLKPSGVVVLTAQTPFDKILGSSCLNYLRYEWIWEKTLPTGHLNAKKAPMKAHENILVFYRSQPTYNPQKTTGHIRKTAVKRKDDTPTYGTQKFDALPYNSTERYPRSVITFASDKQKSNLHPTQKPVSLMQYLIRTYSNEGETVLDNCMGSGTTGIAAALEDRKFIGIEKDQSYFIAATDRLTACRAALAQGGGE